MREIVIGTITDDEIRPRAEELYKRRMALGLDGDAEGDWFAAQEYVSLSKYYESIGRGSLFLRQFSQYAPLGPSSNL